VNKFLDSALTRGYIHIGCLHILQISRNWLTFYHHVTRGFLAAKASVTSCISIMDFTGITPCSSLYAKAGSSSSLDDNALGEPPLSGLLYLLELPNLAQKIALEFYHHFI
jgi:hypothetical protein